MELLSVALVIGVAVPCMLAAGMYMYKEYRKELKYPDPGLEMIRRELEEDGGSPHTIHRPNDK